MSYDNTPPRSPLAASPVFGLPQQHSSSSSTSSNSQIHSVPFTESLERQFDNDLLDMDIGEGGANDAAETAGTASESLVNDLSSYFEFDCATDCKRTLDEINGIGTVTPSTLAQYCAQLQQKFCNHPLFDNAAWTSDLILSSTSRPIMEPQFSMARLFMFELSTGGGVLHNETNQEMRSNNEEKFRRLTHFLRVCPLLIERLVSSAGDQTECVLCFLQNLRDLVLDACSMEAAVQRPQLSPRSSRSRHAVYSVITNSLCCFALTVDRNKEVAQTARCQTYTRDVVVCVCNWLVRSALTNINELNTNIHHRSLACSCTARVWVFVCWVLQSRLLTQDSCWTTIEQSVTNLPLEFASVSTYAHITVIDETTANSSKFLALICDVQSVLRLAGVNVSCASLLHKLLSKVCSDQQVNTSILTDAFRCLVNTLDAPAPIDVSQQQCLHEIATLVFETFKSSLTTHAGTAGLQQMQFIQEHFQSKSELLFTNLTLTPTEWLTHLHRLSSGDYDEQHWNIMEWILAYLARCCREPSVQDTVRKLFLTKLTPRVWRDGSVRAIRALVSAFVLMMMNFARAHSVLMQTMLSQCQHVRLTTESVRHCSVSDREFTVWSAFVLLVKCGNEKALAVNRVVDEIVKRYRSCFDLLTARSCDLGMVDKLLFLLRCYHSVMLRSLFLEMQSDGEQQNDIDSQWPPGSHVLFDLNHNYDLAAVCRQAIQMNENNISAHWLPLTSFLTDYLNRLCALLQRNTANSASSLSPFLVAVSKSLIPQAQTLWTLTCDTPVVRHSTACVEATYAVIVSTVSLLHTLKHHSHLSGVLQQTSVESVLTTVFKQYRTAPSHTLTLASMLISDGATSLLETFTSAAHGLDRVLVKIWIRAAFVCGEHSDLAKLFHPMLNLPYMQPLNVSAPTAKYHNVTKPTVADCQRSPRVMLKYLFQRISSCSDSTFAKQCLNEIVPEICNALSTWQKTDFLGDTTADMKARARLAYEYIGYIMATCSALLLQCQRGQLGATLLYDVVNELLHKRVRDHDDSIHTRVTAYAVPNTLRGLSSLSWTENRTLQRHCRELLRFFIPVCAHKPTATGSDLSWVNNHPLLTVLVESGKLLADLWLPLVCDLLSNTGPSALKRGDDDRVRRVHLCFATNLLSRLKQQPNAPQLNAQPLLSAAIVCAFVRPTLKTDCLRLVDAASGLDDQATVHVLPAETRIQAVVSALDTICMKPTIIANLGSNIRAVFDSLIDRWSDIADRLRSQRDGLDARMEAAAGTGVNPAFRQRFQMRN